MTNYTVLLMNADRKFNHNINLNMNSNRNIQRCIGMVANHASIWISRYRAKMKHKKKEKLNSSGGKTIHWRRPGPAAGKTISGFVQHLETYLNCAILKATAAVLGRTFTENEQLGMRNC